MQKTLNVSALSLGEVAPSRTATVLKLVQIFARPGIVYRERGAGH